MGDAPSYYHKVPQEMMIPEPDNLEEDDSQGIEETSDNDPYITHQRCCPEYGYGENNNQPSHQYINQDIDIGNSFFITI